MIFLRHFHSCSVLLVISQKTIIKERKSTANLFQWLWLLWSHSIVIYYLSSCILTDNLLLFLTVLDKLQWNFFLASSKTSKFHPLSCFLEAKVTQYCLKAISCLWYFFNRWLFWTLHIKYFLCFFLCKSCYIEIFLS